jgi:hypothetical protein
MMLFSDLDGARARQVIEHGYDEVGGVAHAVDYGVVAAVTVELTEDGEERNR